MILRRFLHVFLWTVFFFDGIIDLLGVMPSLLNRLALLSIGALFGITLLRKRVKYPLLPYVAALCGISVLSGWVLGDQSTLATLVFLRQLILLPYLYFIVIVNERSERVLDTVKRTVVLLVLIQVPAFLIKLALVGGAGTEMYIGTVAMREGSMTILITLIPTAFFFAKYLWERRPLDLIMALVFVLLSQIGGKRATLVYVPMVAGFLYLFYIRTRRLSLVPVLRGLAVLGTLLLITTYAVVRLNPWLNPDEAVGGRFDLGYAVEFVSYYNSTTRPADLYEYSRPQAMKYIFSEYLRNQETAEILFGEGAGKLTMANPGVPKSVEPLMHYYGIRYGGRPAIIWVYLQIGLAGVLVFGLMFLQIFKQIRRYQYGSYHKLAAAGIFAVIVLDTLTYSMVTMRFFSIYGMFFTYVGLIYRDELWGTAYLREPRMPTNARNLSSNVNVQPG